ncbi:Glutamate carboxypeptidase 2 [Tupaia chinensis]|uniref:Glutamate carboxypeptidase 2 n=1 Tax=Tupaia chinensis TaxID=246437 RepID=L9J9S5_TUPCH|nr:Glutamate carboxypeptidase 2 [Tupaia chinensis]
MWTLLRQRDWAAGAGRRRRWLCAGAPVLAASLFTLGFLSGWFINSSHESIKVIPQHSARKMFLDELKAENIKKFLHNFTQIPHLAGTEQNFQLAKQIQSQWKEFGLDSVELAHYDVLLSYPSKTHPNYISIIDEDGNEIFNTSLFEPPPPGYENVSDVVPPFSAFSPQGLPEGDLVYVNYARTEDFFKLERDMKINCSGKIVIARYGKVFRGNKVKNAQLAGAKGVILYSDPADYFAPGVESYPDGWNLPGGGVQRGNILNLNGAGDPLTPGYPANEYAYRHEITEAIGLPSIPVHPIGYYDAQKLLEYVILGGHRDSWVFGGIDPQSGAAVVHEIVRSFGTLKKEGNLKSPDEGFEGKSLYESWSKKSPSPEFHGMPRHVIYAPSSHNKYAGESFPGIYDALFDIENKPDSSKAWREVKRQIAVAAFTVQAAAVTLRQVA